MGRPLEERVGGYNSLDALGRLGLVVEGTQSVEDLKSMGLVVESNPETPDLVMGRYSLAQGELDEIQFQARPRHMSIRDGERVRNVTAIHPTHKGFEVLENAGVLTRREGVEPVNLRAKGGVAYRSGR